MSSAFMDVKVTTIGGPDEQHTQGVSDITWQHVTSIAERRHIEVGSDDFVGLYRHLEENYADCAHHMGFLQHTALRGVQQILASNFVALPANFDEQQARAAIIDLAQVMVAWFMWLHTTVDVDWICNHVWDDMPESDRSVNFFFERPSESNDND